MSTQPEARPVSSAVTSRHHVVVGVDGTRHGLHATVFAALAASAAGADLEIVHVVPLHLSSGPAPEAVPPDFDDLGRDIVETAAGLAEATAPGLAVRTRLLHGSATRALAWAGTDADLVVLGAQHEGALAQVWTGRVYTSVAARTRCPTVVVPPEWEPDLLHGRIVVGFKQADGCQELLARAFFEAARRRATLEIVHAWKLPSAYEDMVSTGLAEQSYHDRERRAIEPLIADLRERYPQVPVSIRIRHAYAAPALIEASRSADLVIFTRASHHQIVPHLGSTARAVMRWAACPVLVQPVPAASRTGVELTLERDGALQR